MLTNKLKHHRIVSKNNNTGKYYIETYGCQMNVADTELVQAMLENLGYSANYKFKLCKYNIYKYLCYKRSC